MSIPISGILLDPYGNVARFSDIKLVTLVGSGDVIETSNSTFRTDENGAYAMDVQFGRFAVYMRFNGSNGSYTKIQAITVNSDTIASTLGELLAYSEPLTPDEILIVQALVNEAIAAKDLAQAAELSASLDADSAAADALAAANSVALLAPVPLNGGVWASGQTFTAYNQYMIFGGEAYSPLQGTVLPYTVGTSPDLGFVYQIKLNSLQALSGLTEPSDLAQRHRIETTVTEIATGVFKVGDKLELSDRALAKFIVVSGGSANGYDILSAGAGKTAKLNANGGDVDVQWLGAKGDGATNDQPAIQAAVNLAIANYLNVKFRPTSSYYRINSAIVIAGGLGSQGLKFIGGSTYQYGGYIKAFGTNAIDIQTSIYLELEGVRISGETTSNSFNVAQKLIKITGAGNVIATRSWLNGAGTLIDRSAATDTYYTRFIECRLDTCLIVYDSSVTYNLNFIDCRIKAFDVCVKSASGAGPINFVGGAVEQWTGHIVLHNQNNVGIPINVTGTYIENYPDLVAGGSFPKANYKATSCFFGASSLSTSGCMIYMQGVLRYLFAGTGIIPTVSSSANTFTYERDAVTLKSDTQWIYPSNAIGVMNDSMTGVPIVETPTGTNPDLIYAIEYYTGSKAIGFNPLNGKDLYKKKVWTNMTLQNGYIPSADVNDLAPRYSIQNGALYLGGGIGRVSATAETFATIGALPDADAIYQYVGVGTTANGEVARIRLISTTGEIRVDNYAALTGQSVYLDGIIFQID